MASTSAFMPRLMSVLLAVHLIFLDFLPWVAMVLPPPRYTTLSSLEENILQQGFYYLSLFISGPAVTFVAANIAVIATGWFIDGWNTARQWNRDFICGFGLSVMFCCTLQSCCALILWSLMYACSPESDKTMNEVIQPAPIDTDVAQASLINIIPSILVSRLQEHAGSKSPIPSSWYLREDRVKQYVWAFLKLLCLISQYKYLSNQASSHGHLQYLIRYIAEEILGDIDAIDEVVEVNVMPQLMQDVDIVGGTDLSTTTHPEPLDLSDIVISLEESEIPSEFLCPISKGLCLQPTVSASGVTYDLPNISKWIKQNGVEARDPITRDYISLSTLCPNFALRESITRWANELSKPPRRRTSPRRGRQKNS